MGVTVLAAVQHFAQNCNNSHARDGTGMPARRVHGGGFTPRPLIRRFTGKAHKEFLVTIVSCPIISRS